MKTNITLLIIFLIPLFFFGISSSYKENIVKSESIAFSSPSTNALHLACGYVRDCSSQEELTGAQVRIKNSIKTTVADREGVFCISVEAGDTLVISMIGYNTKYIPINSVGLCPPNTICTMDVPTNLSCLTQR